MAYVPLALAVSATLAESQHKVSRSTLVLASCGLLLVCLIGIPIQIASALYYWNNRDCSQIEALDRKNLTSDDWVYTQYAGYFAARKVTNRVFMPFLIPQRYRDKITVLIVSPEDYEGFAHALIGGDWQDTGQGIADTGHDLMPGNSAAILLQRRINLRVYRRVNPVAKSAR
jgi:hypothetical protein